MIDFHTHILPSIDDGSRNIEETFNMIEEAYNIGFKEIVLTSHYIEGHYEANEPEREAWLKAISENLKVKNINMKLYLANEIFLTENIIQLLEEGKASTINNSCYVLFEMPLNNEPLSLYNVIYSLQENKLIPILAHPERYSFIQKKPNMVYELVQKGCLMQANYGSIIGQYGAKSQNVVKKFFENDLIHFLGSDVHRQKAIYQKIPEALIEIECIIGEEKLKNLTTINPKLAISNKRINIETPKEINYKFIEKVKNFFNK